jgi:hypothetical protein
MSSEGTGASISLQDASDLLHKLSTESTKVEALFTGTEGGIRSTLSGVLRYAPDGAIWVMPDPDLKGGPFIAFDPSVSILRKYGDERALLSKGEGPFGLRFRSLLTFAFRDGSTLSLFEFSDPGDKGD